MASAPRLNAIPVELVEDICSGLPFQDQCNLRLTCREVSAKVSQGSFLTHFRQKSVCINGSEEVRELIHMTAPGRVGCRNQHLTLIAYALATTAAEESGIVEPVSSDEDLTEAMRQLGSHRVRADLLSLSLAVKCRHKDGRIVDASATKKRRRVWQAAATLFRLVSCCLSTSGLRLGALNCFEGVERCSLATREFAAGVDAYHLSGPLSGLESLSLSLSPRPPWSPRAETLQSAELGQGYMASARRFVGLASSVASLRFHWYSLHKQPPPCAMAERELFERMAVCGSLPRLRSCALRGLNMTAGTLHVFMASHPQLTRLCLEEIHLDSGAFASLFDGRARHEPPMEYLYFDDLFEDGGRLLYFPEAKGKAKYPSLGGNIGPNDFVLEGGATREAVKYRFVGGRAMGHPSFASWINRRGRKYGPPNRVFSTRARPRSSSSSDGGYASP